MKKLLRKIKNNLFPHPKISSVEIPVFKGELLKGKTALIIGVFGVFGSLAGAWSASVINDGLLRRIFGVFLAGIGVYEIFCGLKGDFVKK